MVGRLWRGASEMVKDCIPVVLNQAGTRFSNREASTVWTFDGALSQSLVSEPCRAIPMCHVIIPQGCHGMEHYMWTGRGTGRTRRTQLLCHRSRAEQTHSSKCRDMNMAFSKGMLHNAHDHEWKVSRRRLFSQARMARFVVSNRWAQPDAG
jgi:hypothetical protein